MSPPIILPPFFIPLSGKFVREMVHIRKKHIGQSSLPVHVFMILVTITAEILLNVFPFDFFWEISMFSIKLVSGILMLAHSSKLLCYITRIYSNEDT
jgi:hypothetical protein